ncbi:group 1 family glycosyl transferase [Caballeronia hypogeia]|uniref:Group 1 family glycosyl transferase n=1 Tax=Caballeronia hypogeia TaxID=1777140 RepID=A0A158A2S6_9BURK|nr:glycosyltransferase family 4 protein [Caballeronia hypogeia]SAK52019.1 group 1 family glycosyl transferase [Caballeronia hypogeia]
MKMEFEDALAGGAKTRHFLHEDTPAVRREHSAKVAGGAPRVAIVHDWLVTYAGAERVLEQIIACFPDADIFSVVDFLEDRSFLRGKRATTSFIQKLPFAKKRYRAYLPLMPLAIEQLDLSAYDLVISSSHAVAKGVLTGPDQVHVSYVHSPIRYAWDLQHQYLQQSNLTAGVKSLFARLILHYVRNWDIRTSNSVNHFIANSEFIARRIHKVYRRSSKVIFPPVDVDSFDPCAQKEDFYLTASRMVPYKKIDVIVEAFARMPERKLVVIGDGPDMNRIRAKATPNVEIMGYQPFAVLHDNMRRAKAFVFAAEEDFGISVVEAQACGTPVIAFGKGGALETVRDAWGPQPTGMFFQTQTPDAIIDAVVAFESGLFTFDAADCRSNAERFSNERFREGLLAHIARIAPQFVLPPPPVEEKAPENEAPLSDLRVLAVDQSGALGGAELSMLEVVKNMRGDVQTVLFDDGPFRIALEAVGVKVDVLDGKSLGDLRKDGKTRPGAGMLRGVLRLLRGTLDKSRNADVIYVNTQRAMVIGAIAGLIARRPVVWHLRDIVSEEHFGRTQLAIIKWCTKLMLEHVIANSTASAAAVTALTRLREERLDVVFNGISSEPFTELESVAQHEFRARFGLPQDAFVVGCFSRLARWKGQHVLLEALRECQEMHAVFVGAALFGEDEYEAELRAYVLEHGLAERVHFLGFQNDIAACMKAVDVVTHTSIMPEPFGRVIIEGMLSKRPVVATRAGGVMDIVDDGENGILCSPGDAAELARILERLKSNEPLRERLVEQGYVNATSRFGTQRYVESVEKILNDVAGRARKR